MNRAAALAAFLALSACGRQDPPPPATANPERRFVDPLRPQGERAEALLELRAQPPATRREVYPRVVEALRTEAARLDGIFFSPEEEKSALAALDWLAEEQDPLARLKIELHLDRESVKRKRLSDAALSAVALGLAHYPKSDSARETLWAALKDPKEVPVVRSACLKALQSHHPKDLEDRVAAAETAPGDDWLRDLQKRLR
jgi:hypothetical protein